MPPMPPMPISTATPGAQRILHEMVAETLALASNQVIESIDRRLRIGSYEWREPDYRQIVLWADALEMEPAALVRKLMEQEPYFYKHLSHWTDRQVQRKGYIHHQGRLLRVTWDLQLLPLIAFEWVEGLELTHLSFTNPPEKAVDLGSLPLPQLVYLDCAGATSLLWLKTASLPQLEVLLCSGCPADQWNTPSRLDLSGTRKLRYLDCHSNALEGIDLSATPALIHLDCSYNQIVQLELDAVPQLQFLDCSENDLSGLSLPQTAELRYLDCSLNPISRLELSGAAQLQTLICTGSGLEQLDLGGCRQLRCLHCGGNPIRELDIRPFERLETLNYDETTTRLIKRPDQRF